MTELDPRYWWRRFLALPNDSRTKTFVVAFLVAAFSALAVSITAVSLKPMQDANIEAERRQRMAEMLASIPGLSEILEDAEADSLETHVVDLVKGVIAEEIDPASFDPEAVVSDPNLFTFLEEDEDIVGIGRRPDLVPIHVLRQDGELELLVLPAYGSGYQSTIRAYVALEKDLNTIAAISIYEQGETPGLGTRITEPAWQNRWKGKQIADETGTVRIDVVQGATGPFEVDGISGATRSSTGVANLVRFWLGEHGFGPFLANLREGGL